MESQKELEAQKQAEPATPGAASARAGRQGNVQADADQKRQLQALQLKRESILSQRTSSPHRRNALATALADIEEKLAELGWTVHL